MFGTGEQFEGFDYIPERSQVTRNSKLAEEHISVGQVQDTTYDHFSNWIDAMVANDPNLVNNDPLLGAAAITTVILGAAVIAKAKRSSSNLIR